MTVFPGDTPPDPIILDPEESPTEPGKADLEWAVGEPIEFDGEAGDAEDGSLASTRLEWTSRLYHCPGGAGACHAHPLQAYPSTATGTLIPPEHDYPAHLELRLTATDSRGLSASRVLLLYPRTVTLDFATEPPGLPLTAGLINGAAPFTVTAIEGSTVGIAAPAEAELGGRSYLFDAWSDEGARAHTVVADASAVLTATYLTEADPEDDDPPGGGGSEGGGPPPAGPPAPGGPPSLAGSPAFARHPHRRTTSKWARFSFKLDGFGGGYRCRLDRRRPQACGSRRTFRHLRFGRHVLRVEAMGADGGPASETAVFRWRVLRAGGHHGHRRAATR